jgi:Transposase DDE domain group 1
VVERTTKRSADCPPACDWIIRFYNQRGTAEQHIKEGKQAINWTRLSCKGMAQNEVRLQLHALAYNLGVFLQGAELPEEIADWSLTSLQTRLIKIGARVVRHARAITFQLAEVAISGDCSIASWRRSSGCVHRRFPYDCASDKT